MPVNNVSLNSPADFTVAQQQIERQRKMAEMLQQESMQQDQGQMVSGWYVPTSPTQHLAKLLQGYVSGKTTEAADQRQKDLVTQKQQYSQGVLDQFTHDTTPRPLGDNEVGARYTPTASDVNSATARMLMGLGGDPAQSAALLAQNAQKNAEDAKYAQLFAPPAGMTQQQATNAALTYGAQNGQAGATPMAAEMQEQLMRSKPVNPMNPNGLPTQIAIEAYRKDPAKYAETYLNPEYSTTPQYDQNGRAFVMNKRGEPKYLDGILERDKMEISPSGQVYNPKSVKPGQIFTDPNKPFATGANGKPIANQAYQNYELGKASAGATRLNIPINTERTYAGNIGDALAKQDSTIIEAGRAAPQRMESAGRVLELLKKTPITGTAADQRLSMEKALVTAGLIDGTRVANTEGLASELASQTLDAIRTSGLGAGNGFTNTDRDFLERAKGGKIDMQPQALQRLAELNQKAAIESIKRHNGVVTRLKKDKNMGSVSDALDLIPLSPLNNSAPPAPTANPANSRPSLESIFNTQPKR